MHDLLIDASSSAPEGHRHAFDAGSCPLPNPTDSLEARMDLFNAHDLTRLADEHGGPRISVFLPTHRGGPQTERNRLRLKNLLQKAQHALRADGMRIGEIDAVIEPARQLLDVTSIWNQ